MMFADKGFIKTKLIRQMNKADVTLKSECRIIFGMMARHHE